MANKGAQPGNQNAAIGSATKQALKRSLARLGQQLAAKGVIELPKGNSAATWRDGLEAITGKVVGAGTGRQRARVDRDHPPARWQTGPGAGTRDGPGKAPADVDKDQGRPPEGQKA